jgi:hypothetical protein
MTMMIFGELQAKILVIHRMYLGRKGETKKAEITGRQDDQVNSPIRKHMNQ